MNNNNGFTLAEMVAVIAILMLLAALSTPFVKGYINDAYNGKAQTYMRQLHEARLNFERDYPGTTISSNGQVLNGCDIDSIYGSDNLTLNEVILIKCNYLKSSSSLNSNYTFVMGPLSQGDGGCSTELCENADIKVTMRGGEKAGIYQGKCACMNSLGEVFKEEEGAE